MLELRRLRLLRELHARGTIAAVADALQFTPSAVSQQLAMLERETGVRLLERAGRGVRLTDAAFVLVEHADALLSRAAIAEADLAAAAGVVSGRGRIASFQSGLLRIGIPAIEALARDAPRLRCELLEAEPEHALPALALGDVDLVLGDEWEDKPWGLPAGVERVELLRDPVHLVLPAASSAKALPDLARAAWTTGRAGMAWEAMVQRTCREHGGFEPDIRHRTNDATVSLALVARGLAVTLLPQLVLPLDDPAFAFHPVPASRTIYAVTRTADAARPSTRALLAAAVAASVAVAKRGRTGTGGYVNGGK
jgi:DNA-binding transcriptional LysR family regulator